jgi:hypothetical protein
MIKVNVFHTNSKLILKGLFLNEDKTFVIGKVQNKDSKLEYISTKWEINKKEKTCKCVLDDKDYDFSIEGIYIEGLNEVAKVKKNFYTFNKDAWHCKLYKWVYGKEPHKVHPTMCPYFWIMVVTLLPPVFALILIVKMFGKTGTTFMEKCATYKARKKQREYEKKCKLEEEERKKYKIFLEELKQLSESDDYEKISKAVQHSDWYQWKWDVGDDVRYKLIDKAYEWRQKEREKEIEKQHQQYLAQQKEAKQVRQQIQTKKVVKNESKPFIPPINKDSKTAKIIGIGLIVIALSFVLVGLYQATEKLIEVVNWVFVGKVLLGLLALVGILFGLYFTIVYILIPFYTYILFPFYEKVLIPFYNIFCKGCIILYNKILTPFYKYCIVKPVEYSIIKPILWSANKISNVDAGPIERFFQSIVKGIVYIGRLIAYPFVMLYVGFIHMIEFFKMCKDLIYQMYKKNCPTITWVEEEENNNK